MRFLESLAAWLQQFKQEDRETAYDFVRNNLVYISAAERERLVALLYPREIYPRLLKAAAEVLGIDSWFILASRESRDELARQRRATLFLALSDGARLDNFRHMHPDLSNEQIVVGVQLAVDKWQDLMKELRSDLDDENARFQRVVLVDDFTASGTSLIRFEPDKWKGKLQRFYSSVGGEASGLLASGHQLIVHHHLGTAQASKHLHEMVPKYLAENCSNLEVPPGSHAITFGHLYEDVAVTDEAFLDLATRHFDSSLLTKHTSKGGSSRFWLGYAECRLPIVLDHNTPNNSFPILWAKTAGAEGGVAMHPLFRRRQRHS
ncbi:hypothetical protein WIW49_02510 [Xanthomonas euroxanthea]